MIRLLIAVLGIFCCLSTQACDVCACYFGVQPQFEKNFAGARLRYRQYYGNINYSQGNTTVNNYSLDIWGRFYPTERVQILAAIPFLYSRMQSRAGTASSYGPSDIMLLSQYRIFSNITREDVSLTHTMFAGAGIKLPTGKYKVDPGETPAGSGSVDFILSFNYIGRINKFGVSLDGSWKINCQNQDGFRYGNSLNNTIHGFLWLKKKSFNLLPHAGFYFEGMEQDRLNNIPVPNTGSAVLFASAGTDIFYKNFSLNFSLQRPVLEKYQGRQLENYLRVISGVTYMF